MIAIFQESTTEENIDGYLKHTWVQPDNKQEPCKLWFQGEEEYWKGPGTSVYWDGDCKDGYAFGLGREFVESIERGLQADLASYGTPGEEPDYYYKAAYDDHHYLYISKVNAKNDSFTHGSKGVAISNPGTRDFYISEITWYWNTQERAQNYQYDFSFTGRTRFVRTYSPDKAIIFNLSNNPSDAYRRSVTFIDGPIELASVVDYGNGVVNHYSRKKGITTQVTLPENVLGFLDNEGPTAVSTLSTIESSLVGSKRAMSIYKRKICKSDVSVDFMADTIYGRICLPEGDLTPYSEQISQYQQEQQELWAKAEKRRQEQQQLAAQQRDAAARRAAQARAETAEAIAELGDSMTEFNKNATSFTQSLMNQQAPAVNMNGSSSTQTNCVMVSNIINCNTR